MLTSHQTPQPTRAEQHASGNDVVDAATVAEHYHSPVNDLFRSAAYSFQSSINGGVQLANKLIGSNILPAVHLTDTPEPTKPYSLCWFTQQIGNGIGMAPGFLAISRGVGKLAGMVTEAPAFYSSAAVLAKPMALADGAVSGFLFGSCLSPTLDTSTNFFGDRLKQGVESGLTFGTLAGASVGLRSLGSGLSGPSRAWFTNPITTNFAGALPAGFVGAEGHARLFENRDARADEICQSIAGMASVGVALPLLHKTVSTSLDYVNRSVLPKALTLPVVREMIRTNGSTSYGSGENSLESVVGRMLADRQMTLAVAESCTGGLVSQRLTDVGGSSRYIKLNVVTYANEAKHKILKVDQGILDNQGPVSPECARAMALGVKNLASTDIGLSVTGFAGPTGDTVGLVYFGLADKNGCVHKKVQFPSNLSRTEIRNRAASTALNMVQVHLQTQADDGVATGKQSSVQRGPQRTGA